MGKGKGGSQVGLLLVLLAILGGVGAWNYQRNLEAEAAEPRPYASYSDEQLVQLAAAYGGQVDQLEGRYEKASGRRTSAAGGKLLGDAVDEFRARAALEPGRARPRLASLAGAGLAARDRGRAGVPRPHGRSDHGLPAPRVSCRPVSSRAVGGGRGAP